MSSVSQFSPNTGIAAGSPLVASLLNGLVQTQSYVLSGGVPPTSVSLVVAMPSTTAVVLATSGTYSGVAIWNSVAGGNITLPASKDNYIDLQTTVAAYPFTGSYQVTSVANGDPVPAPVSNGVRLCKVVTSGTAATSVTPYTNPNPLGITPLVQAHHSTAFGAPSGAWQTSPLNTTLYDTLVGTTPQHSTSVNNSRLTCQVAGYYRLTGTVQFSALATGTMRGVRLVINGTPSLVVSNSPPLALSCLVVTTTTFLSVSDYLEMQFFNDSTDPAAIYSPNLMMEQIR